MKKNSLILLTLLFFTTISYSQSDTIKICENTNIIYDKNFVSTNLTILSWDWKFEGGEPSTSNRIKETVFYKTPGIYETVSTLVLSDSSIYIKKKIVEVLKYISDTLENDTFIVCKNQNVLLRGIYDENLNTYLWTSPTSSLENIFETTKDISVKNKGLYKLRLYNFCKSKIKDYYVFHDVGCTKNLYLPNAFTPNFDNLNDSYKPVYDENANINFKIQIYNRYGEKIYENINEGWNGFYKGNLVKSGTYVVILHDLDENIILKKEFYLIN